MKDINSIYDLIDSESFRQRPGMYIGKKFVTVLRTFMIGYDYCEEINQISTKDTSPPFWLFMYYVAKATNQTLSGYNWDGMLLNKYRGDESKAFDKFLFLFDNFRKITPIETKIFEPNESQLEHFNSQKTTSWTIINKNQIPEKAASKIVLTDYSSTLGCSLSHERKEYPRTDYFETQEIAIRSVIEKYGESTKFK